MEQTTNLTKIKILGRNFLYPKKASGKLFNYRQWFSYALILILFSLPYLTFKDEQLVLLNILERKFVFFGFIFTPQDFYLFALAMLIFIISIVSFTVVLGRLWCGWACPQTIFMEMIFRRIEYMIEGDVPKQKKLDTQPWDAEKILKKGVKHFLFLVVSFAIANTFLAYIIGSDQLYKIISEPISEHLIGFVSIWIFTLVFYGVYAYVREVVCTVICPYGRLQGVMLDSKSLIVAYDEPRGEPRGKLQKNCNSDQKLGDCVDCGLCVQVCPTGIDIRKGTQLECINCTACIDACNAVMTKINKPQNLVGFYTQDYLKSGKRFKLSLRAYGYAIICFVLILVLSALVYKRQDVETTVLRASGTTFQTRDNGMVSNLYNAELVNKTNKDINFTFKTKDDSDQIQIVQAPKILAKESRAQVTFFVVKKHAQIKKIKTDIQFEILSNGKVISTAETSFFAQPQ